MEVKLIIISFKSQVLLKLNLVKYQRAILKIFLTSFWLNAGDWKLVPGPFMILVKSKYSEIRPFLTVDV